MLYITTCNLCCILLYMLYKKLHKLIKIFEKKKIAFSLPYSRRVVRGQEGPLPTGAGGVSGVTGVRQHLLPSAQVGESIYFIYIFNLYILFIFYFSIEYYIFIVKKTFNLFYPKHNMCLVYFYIFLVCTCIFIVRTSVKNGVLYG